MTEIKFDCIKIQSKEYKTKGSTLRKHEDVIDIEFTNKSPIDDVFSLLNIITSFSISKEKEVNEQEEHDFFIYKVINIDKNTVSLKKVNP
ncbi:hypothetical protein [Lysinibacillus xylanilyticus]|uniref:hypothetical protein n=1 Tax=Lysinibacillus xylanilyticus TaxID=582475 RepID=UPI003D084390